MESLARPGHRRKLSNTNGVFSFSSRNSYDDVLAAVPPPAPAAAVAATAKEKFKGPVGVEEYGEIFGGGSLNSSSIPVLDLSALDDESKTGSGGHRSSSRKQLDYSKIFGGFGDDDIAVPYQVLVAERSKKCYSDKTAMNQSSEEFPLQGSENCRLSGKNKDQSSETSDQSLDGVKQVNMSYHKSSPRSKNGTSGTMHVAKLQAVPGFTYFIDETVCKKKTEGDKPEPKVKSEVPRTWSFSGNIPEDGNVRKTEMLLPNKITSEGVIQGKHGSWLKGFRLNDKLFYSGEINPRSHTFKSPPTSSSPTNLNDNKRHPKRSKSSSFTSTSNAFEKACAYSTCSSDEELDMNSAAAASAAFLRKAIEQAQESIRLAKELMERKKDGFQGHAKPSSKGRRNRKQSRIEQKENNIKENEAKDTFRRFNDELQGPTGRDRTPASQSDEGAKPSEESEEFSASGKFEVGNHKKDVKTHAETMLVSGMRSNGNQRTSSTSGTIENRNSDKQPCVHDEMKISEETSECIMFDSEKTKAIEEENRTKVHRETDESEEIIHKVVSTRMLPEHGVSDNLQTTKEDVLTLDMRNHPDGLEVYEEEFHECLDDMVENLDTQRLEVNYSGKKSPDMVEKEKEPQEPIPREHMVVVPEIVPVMENKNDSGLGTNGYGGGGELQDEARQFVAKDDETIDAHGSGYGKLHSNTLEKYSERSNLIRGRDIDEMVVIQAYDMEETPKISDANTEEEEFKELDFKDTRKISDVNLKEEEFKELNLKGMEPIHTHDGDNCKKILTKEHKSEEVQRTIEETDDHQEANERMPEKETECEIVEKCKKTYLTEKTENCSGEAERSIENLTVEVMQVADVAGNVHVEADNCAKNHEGCFCHRDTCLLNHEQDQEANRSEECNEDVKTRVDALRNHEYNCNISAPNEAFYQYERDADVAVGAFKEASKVEVRESFEAADFVRSSHEEHIISDDIQSAVNIDGIGASGHCNEINCAPEAENTSETAKVHDALEVNGVGTKIEALEADLSDEKAADTATCVKNGKEEVKENVEREMSFNPECSSGTVHELLKNAEESGVSFDKAGKTYDVKVVTIQSNGRDDLTEAKPIPVTGKFTTNQVSMETYKEMQTAQKMQHEPDYLKKSGAMVMEVKENKQKGVKEKDDPKKVGHKRERERNTDRIAVERVIREARERAFVEARERAERAAVEREAAEARQRAMAEAQGKVEKTTAGSKVADKASADAKLRAERAAVERATAEARERALEKALSQKSAVDARVQAEKFSTASRDDGLKHSFSASDFERLDGTSSESDQRRKARLERHQRIMERAAKALEEKNRRDRLAQKEQAERNRLAEVLDADIKRWASGKEGNLRALLSTLQYILGPDSGWQPISLTEIITTAAVKKAYRKATLYVHPDKLQQRGASIQQKYICEKVFDLLKAAWNRFNSEER